MSSFCPVLSEASGVKSLFTCREVRVWGGYKISMDNLFMGQKTHNLPHIKVKSKKRNIFGVRKKHQNETT